MRSVICSRCVFSALLDALAKGLLADEHVSSARILASNTTNGVLGTSVWWVKQPGSLEGPRRIEEEGLQVGTKPSVNYPWQVIVMFSSLFSTTINVSMVIIHLQ